MKNYVWKTSKFDIREKKNALYLVIFSLIISNVLILF